MDTISSEVPTAPFAHAISEAFEPYLYIWVEAQDIQLASFLTQYRSRPPLPPGEEFHPQMVISSSTELFTFYRQIFAQCAKLSTGQRLADLSRVLAKYLDQYAQQVLLYYISEKPTGATPSRIPSIQDTILVLNTADYCYTTSLQLEERIKTRIDETQRDHVDLQSQADAFMGIASAAIRSLIRKVEVDLEPSWREMRNTSWSKLQGVGDQSTYVAELTNRIKTRAEEVMGMLHKLQYARAFCDNLVDMVANTYMMNIALCKPISEIGAEQVTHHSPHFHHSNSNTNEK